MIAWVDVVEFAPEMSTVPVNIQTIILGIVSQNINPAIFCGSDTALYTLACLNFAAHHGTVMKNANESAGQAGPVQSESVGGLSVSYGGGFGAARAAAANSRAGYETTAYGAAYLSLLRTSPCAGYGIMVV